MKLKDIFTDAALAKYTPYCRNCLSPLPEDTEVKVSEYDCANMHVDKNHKTFPIVAMCSCGDIDTPILIKEKP